MVPTYRYYRRQLQHFLLRTPERRMLRKAPAHLFCLDALLTVFPDACIIETHRPVVEALPSLCSLTSASSGMFSDYVDKGRLGTFWLDRIANGLQQSRSARRSAPASAHFVDVEYAELCADAPGVVRRICETLGLGFPDGLEAKIRQHLAAKPKGAKGPHVYSLEEYLLDRDQVNARCAG